jgi:hypothetical protein
MNVISSDEIFRRGRLLGYDVEIVQRVREVKIVSIFDHHPTAQPGYEYPRLFRGKLLEALSFIETREAMERERAKV